MTPDGRRLFFAWNVTGIHQVWRIDGPGQFPVQVTGGEDATELTGITPDGKHLLLSRDRKGEENPGLYLQRVEGGPLTTVQHAAKVQTFLQYVTDDSRYLYYKANDRKPDAFAIYRYEIATATRELVFEQEGLWSLEDVSKEGRLLLSRARANTQIEYHLFDPANRSLTPLFGQGEGEKYKAMFGPQPGELLVVTSKFGEFERLYRWREGKFEPLSSHPEWDVVTFQIDRPRRRILYQTNEAGFLKLWAIDARTGAKLELPTFDDALHVTLGSTTPDGRSTLLGVETAYSPRIEYVYDWQTRTTKRWMEPSLPEVDTRTFVQPRLEFFPARDGTQIPMWVRRPASCIGPCPVVVKFHGGPESQALPHFDVTAQLFVEAGYVYVEPNVRGSTGYGKQWAKADDGPKRLQVITDIEDCALHIKRRWGSEGKVPKVGIMGGSYGGYSTLMGMTRFAGAYDVGVSSVGISNLFTFLMNTAPYRRILRISEYGDPEADREALLQLSPTTFIDRVNAPLLILQGANDPRVPVGEAVQMYDALRKRNVLVELSIFPNEGHGARRRENVAQQLGETLRFFERHLRP